MVQYAIRYGSPSESSNRSIDPVKKYFQLQAQGSKPGLSAIISAIKACKLSKDLGTGTKIHDDVIQSKDLSNVAVANSLIDMYVKCGCVAEAREVFDGLQDKDVVSWTSIILGLARQGYGDQALDLYGKMENDGCSPDRVAVLAALKACAAVAEKSDCSEDGEVGEIGEDGSENQDAATGHLQPRRVLVKMESLRRGKEIHARAARIGVELDTFVASSLVDMYCKCGSMIDAGRVFDCLPEQTVVLLTTMMLGYAQRGDGDLGLEFFERMKAEGLEPDRVTLLAALKACSSAAEKGNPSKFLEKGRSIARGFRENDVADDIVLATALIDMFSKCGSIVEARRVFDRIRHRDVVSWNCIILGYAQNRRGEDALILYSRMLDEGFVPDSRTLLAALKACVSLVSSEERKLKALRRGRVVHSHSVRYLDEMELVFETSLVDFYGKCGSLIDSAMIFESSRRRSAMLWTSIIASHGHEESALELYRIMQDEGFDPKIATLVAVLKSLSALASKEVGKIVEGRFVKPKAAQRGRLIHAAATRNGKNLDRPVATSLVNLFTRSGVAAEARLIFESLRNDQNDDVALWNCLLAGYAENDEPAMALELYSEMIRGRGPAPDRITLLGAMKACACLSEKEIRKTPDESSSLKLLKEIHARAARTLDEEIDLMLANTLLDSYAKCRSMIDAVRVFERIRQPDAVSWNCIVSGFLENDRAVSAIESLDRMKIERGGGGFNSVTYLTALKACAALGALDRGRRFHAEIRSAGLETETAVANSLIDFYGKCGSMIEAEEVFRRTSAKNLVSWSALISGYSCQGDTDRALGIFETMKLQGRDLQPDGVTYLSVLTACSRAGCVERGKGIFDEMRSRGVSWSVDHYACMVDLLGRSNRLDEAVEFLRGMPSAESWMALLSACHKWRNLEVGKIAFESLIKLDRGNASAYVMMSNIYACCGDNYEHVEELRFSS